jgi:hypothetical protein
MDPYIWDISKMICQTDLELCIFQIGKNTKDSLLIAKCPDMELITTKMVANIQEIFQITKDKVMEQ